MDPLEAFLSGPRARNAFLLRSLMSPPWGIRVQDQAPLTVVVVQHGSAWIVRDGMDPLELRPGDAVLLRGPEPYLVAHHPASETTAIINPGQHCSGPGGEDLTPRLDSEVRTWGNDPNGPDALLIGTYLTASEVGRSLLERLPAQYLLRQDGQLEPVIELLLEELHQPSPARTAALDRLLDLLLIRMLRRVQAELSPTAPGWLTAQADPLVRQALQAIHRRPGDAWTVEKLARTAGTSRANLARRFSEAVGQPPMTYLSRHRLDLAADLLLGDDRLTTAVVADRVGYSTPYSFSHAFKVHHGVSPRAYRKSRPPASLVP